MKVQRSADESPVMINQWRNEVRPLRINDADFEKLKISGNQVGTAFALNSSSLENEHNLWNKDGEKLLANVTILAIMKIVKDESAVFERLQIAISPVIPYALVVLFRINKIN